MINRILLLLLSVVHGYQFAVVPKRTNNPFFTAVKDGCQARAAMLQNVTCLYTGPEDRGANATDIQIEILEDLWDDIDGFAVAVMNETAISKLIERAVSDKKFVVTFDSDATNSQRHAYVGTDNKAFGRELAHVLMQLAPNGGTYGILASSTASSTSERVFSPNIWHRIEGVREGLERTGWTEVSTSPADAKGKSLLALEEMEKFMETHPDMRAIVPVGGWPMFESNAWEAFVRRHPQVTTVVGDALDVQIALMNRGSADGLVGQLPFQMGEQAIDKLFQLTKSQEQGLDPPFKPGAVFATSVLNVLQIPQDIPPLQVDMNYLGGLSILGWVLCGSVVTLSIICMTWTYAFRGRRVVRASQPIFLSMICFGTLLMGSAIIPLSLDDQRISLRGCSIACMCVPWLIIIGFAMTFSALFSKTWRIVKVYESAQNFQRVRVTAQDVIVPFAVLLTLNVIVLLCWTLINPLQYERRPHSGTDYWNRVSRSYYGACFSSDAKKGSAIPYAVCLVVINFIVILIANLQAYRARKIETEFSESRYIAFIMVTMLQACIVGVPILALVRDDPQSYFVVITVIIFVTCMATLLFLFIPKILRMQEADRRASSEAMTARTVIAESRRSTPVASSYSQPDDEE